MIGAMSTIAPTAGQLSAAGKRAARTIYYKGPRKARYSERFDVVYAKAALEELEHLIDTKTPGLFAEQQEGIDASVEDLHVRPERALAEIAQNADDCGARGLRFAFRAGADGRDLLCAHDGTRVTLRDAVGMTFAYISGKREETLSKGKFGIGLKTIAGMASSFDVHCHPYHFTVERQHPQWTDPEPDIPGFWAAESGHTLLVLHLHEGYDESGAVEWLDEWGTDSMLFLESLRHLEFSDLVGGRLGHLTVTSDDLQPIHLPGIEVPVSVRRTVDSDDPARSWTIYSCEVVAPPHLKRAHKKRDRTTPLGIAIPLRESPTQIFAGLPLDEDCKLPVSVHGQFDPDSKRAQLRKTDWNEFVIVELGKLTTAVLLDRFARDPATAWQATPRRESAAGRDRWTVQQFGALVAQVRKSVADRAVLPGPRDPVPLADLVYEAPALEGVVDADDLSRLAEGCSPLSRDHRDEGSSWRLVLADLERGRAVSPEQAAAMLDWPDIGIRPAHWYAELLEAILATRSVRPDRQLDGRRCVLLADGTRITPKRARESAAIITREAAASALASRLGLALLIDRAFADECDAREHAGKWLERVIGLRDRPSGEQTLGRLARRSLHEPLVLDDDQLVALRDELSKLSAGKLEDLGPRIGERIRVRGYEVLRGRRHQAVHVAPTEAYLSATIDGHGATGFPQVARDIPGFHWIQPSYAELLKTARGSRRLAARPLFLSLGAHAAPRLRQVPETWSLHDDHAAPLRRTLPETQGVAIARLDHPREQINGVRGDHDSRDLIQVLDHITKLRGVQRQRAARALILSLDREWRRYADVTTATAMYGYGWWYERGSIPATWLARIQSTAFMTSESGRIRRPVDLALRSEAYVAVMGEDPAAFCKEIREGQISPEVAETLGFAARPRVRRIILELTRLRAADTDGRLRPSAISTRAAAAYLALAVYCREAGVGTRRLTGRDQVDDVRVDELRAMFSDAEGLVYADGQWHRPRDVFRGARIFGDLRPFVSPSEARALWDILGIGEPSISDCAKVLIDLAVDAEPPHASLLTGIYTRIESELDGEHRPREVRRLPLWTGREWRADRPIYAVGQEALAHSLADCLPVWGAPCSLAAVSKFARAAAVTVLDPRTFEPQGIGPGHRAAGGKVRPHFLAAVRYFAELLGKDYPEVHINAPVSFDDLEAYDLAHSAKLEVVVALGPVDVRPAPVQVFASEHHRLVAFRDPDALGRHEIGGMAIAALFDDARAAALAPLWEIAWQRADPENLREKVRLAREDPVEDDPLKTLMENAGRRKAAKALVDDRDEPQPSEAGQPRPRQAPAPTQQAPRRHLRDLSKIRFGNPKIIGDDEPGTRRHRQRGPLKEPPSQTRTHFSPPSKEPKGIREYTDKEKETEGFKLLKKALKSVDGSELEDYRDLRGMGSDSIDNLRRYFELKAHAGEIPDDVSLTGLEVERAVREGGKYFLAVVGGLETGDVMVKIFAHPLATLDFVEAGSIVLSGVSRKRALELRPIPSESG